MTFRVEVAPRFDYGRTEHEVERHDQGVVFRSARLSLALGSNLHLETRDGDVHARFVLSENEATGMTLESVDDGTPPFVRSAEEIDRLLGDTVTFWRGWLSQSRYRGRWREMVHRSALALKLLTYEPTGAIVAAATTSLPEQIGGERNWDYRHTWIRDAAFSAYALLRLGFTEEAHSLMTFLTHRFAEGGGASGPLQVMYGVDGRHELPEQVVEGWEGYAGSTPVRIGNAATGQLQLDIYGELIDAVYLYNKYGAPISHRTWNDVREIVDWVCEHWDQADEGIWEVRGGRDEFVYSRLMCWVAVERAVRMARQRGLPGDIVRWMAARDAIYEQIMDRGWHPERRAFVQHYDTDVLDASVLLMPLVKFIAPTDPLWLATLDAISPELVSDSLVYRYNTRASPDGLRGEEGTFSICTFWYVEALARAGRLDRLAEALAIQQREGLTPFTVLQPHYNLVERDYERTLARIVDQYDLAVCPYFALAQGFLTGKYRAGAPAADSPPAEGARAYLGRGGEKVLAALDDVAAAHGASVAAVALAWLRAQPHVVAPIASARTVEQVEEIAPIVELTPDELERVPSV